MGELCVGIALGIILIYPLPFIDSMTLIGIATDFGDEDQYVFQMKSVIDRINPNATIYDITHKIPKFDIWAGSFILLQAVRYVPEGSIIIGIVDPEVATKRKPLAIKTHECVLLGPDNGLLYEAASSLNIEEIRQITSGKVVLKRGSTFDGRDVFSPTAAHLSLGMNFSEVGEKLDYMEKFTFPKPKYRRDYVKAYIIYIDSFKNATLGLPAKEFKNWTGSRRNVILRIGTTERAVQIAASYKEIKEVGLIEGSTGLMEISSYKSGAPIEALSRGEQVTILLE